MDETPLPPVIELDSIDSTSTHARRLVQDGRETPFLVAARTQTAGRGQLSRSWASPDAGLWCTLAWATPVATRRETLHALGLRIGVACVQLIDETLAAHGSRATVTLKWPNDVLVDRRKVLGVLTETIPTGSSTAILVGVGINANFRTSELPTEVASRATSLMDVTGSTVDLRELRDRLARRLLAAMKTSLTPSVLTEARARLHGVGENVYLRTDDMVVEGTLIGLSDDGAPLVRTANGIVESRRALE